MKKWIFCFLITSVFTISSFGIPSKVQFGKFPNQTGWINDFEDILSESEEDKLEKLVIHFHLNTTNQLVIATIGSIDAYSNIEEYSTGLFNEWGIGQKNKNNGVMIIVFSQLHKVRIEVGYGAESMLTNAICSDILEKYMIPSFKKKKYFKGIMAGTNQIIKKWK